MYPSHLERGRAPRLLVNLDHLVQGVGLRQELWAVDGVLCKTTEYAELVFVPLSPHFLISPISCSFPHLPGAQPPVQLSETCIFSSPHEAPQSPST